MLFGDGNDATLRAKIRAFREFTEYASLMLILLAPIEETGAPQVFGWAAGLVFLMLRIGHAIGFVLSVKLRGVTMISRYLACFASGLWLVGYQLT